MFKEKLHFIGRDKNNIKMKLYRMHKNTLEYILRNIILLSKIYKKNIAYLFKRVNEL